MTRLRVLICGSRHWTDSAPVADVLDGLRSANDDELVVIHGGARGADSYAEAWLTGARNPGRVDGIVYAADWDQYGRAAGPIRNQQMLDDGQPDVVYAFHDDLPGSGTEGMCELASQAGVPVYVVSHYTPKEATR